ncbi:MAG: MBOAT family protein [Lachnospiraceae bacterium]|nr:MBOAT family protein [Lachnospiraceae bacterium]
MQFNSLEFLIFFPIVVGIYFVIPKKIKYIWLLIASYYFYMCWNAKYAILIAFSTAVTYLSGRLLEKTTEKISRKLIVALSFTVNLGILAFFKYFDFLLENLNAFLSALHLHTAANPFSLVLPVGISFYTFQALGYTVDVYRGTVKAEKNFLKYALFVSFFPQLVAGPIERTGHLLSQIEELDKKRLWNYEKIVSGFSLMVWGMFMKMVIADRCAAFVKAVHENLFAAGTVETVAAAILFSIQIYCDFGGYSAIAIGAARIMGFDLMENFNTPYFATSISDFWRRWHVSLSTWFRDYLYIPLGGNRCSKVKKYRNILITFLCSGLWHGTTWTFVVWGGLHGVYQIVGDLLKPVREKAVKILKIKTDVFSFRLGQILITYSLVTFGWIFFRAERWSQVVLYFNRMFTRFNPWVVSLGGLDYLKVSLKDTALIVVFLVILLLGDLARYLKKCDFGVFLMEQNLWFRWCVLLGLILCVLVFGEYGIHFDSAQFIYFAF